MQRLIFVKPAWVEMGYLNQYTFGANGPDKRDHVVAVSLFWNF